MRRAAPETSGTRCLTHAALTACRVAKLSQQSTTTSMSGSSWSSSSDCSCFSNRVRRTSGLMACKAFAAEATLVCPTRSVVCAICRCRLVRSTLSGSAKVMCPTPLEAKYIATGEPRPPAPTTNTWLSGKRCWPSMPISSRRIWRE